MPSGRCAGGCEASCGGTSAGNGAGGGTLSAVAALLAAQRAFIAAESSARRSGERLTVLFTFLGAPCLRLPFGLAGVFALLLRAGGSGRRVAFFFASANPRLRFSLASLVGPSRRRFSSFRIFFFRVFSFMASGLPPAKERQGGKVTGKSSALSRHFLRAILQGCKVHKRPLNFLRPQPSSAPRPSRVVFRLALPKCSPITTSPHGSHHPLRQVDARAGHFRAPVDRAAGLRHSHPRRPQRISRKGRYRASACLDLQSSGRGKRASCANRLRDVLWRPGRARSRGDESGPRGHSLRRTAGRQQFSRSP